MSATLQDTQALFRLGHHAKIVADAGSFDSRRHSLSAEHRVLVAHALFHAGDGDKAFAIAEAENNPQAPASLRSQCELILGLVHRRRGDILHSHNHFNAAVRFANDAKDHGRAAWGALQRFRTLAETRPGDEILVMAMKDARRMAALAGDPHVSAYLHDSIALMEASVGRLAEAKRHLKICRALLDRDPNAWLEQVASVNGFFVDFVEGRYQEALRHLRTARNLLPLTGDRQRVVIECNEGHALLVIGRFGVAADRFAKILAGRSGLPVLAALDGLARVYLATDRLEECRSTLATLEELSGRDASLRAAFAARWTAITRGKLLLRLGLYDEACDRLKSDLLRAEYSEDRLLVGFLKCLRAEALSGCRKPYEAANALLLAEIGVEACTPDYRAAYNRAAATVLSDSGHPLYRIMLARANAVWQYHGNRCATSELKHLAIAAEVPQPRSSASATTTILSVVNHLGNAFGVAYSARLLGNELLQAIRALECSDDARITEFGNSSLEPSITEDRVVLPLGEDRGNKLALRCPIPGEPVKAILLGDVLRVGRAALALERFQQEERNRAALWPADPVETEAGALFLDEEMQSLLATARRVAASTIPVLITGETGTGKEVLARLIHAYSPRAKNLFLPFNCTATPKDMLDSQLFGHRRGSFTGAVDHFQGVIRGTAGGTLFLDEIGETTLDVQPKLLRFLESSEVHPIGETQPSRVDVRVIAATNADLDALVTQGRFREDLYYRLNVIPLHVPPLRERRVEIPALAHHYLRKFALEHHKGDLRLAEETMEFLVLYRWPGNVRQLANEMRRMAVVAEKGAVLMPEHLSPDIAASRRTIPASERTLEPTEVVVRLDQPLPAGVGHIERAMILYTLKQCGGRMEETASRLGISRKGLYLKRQRYGLEMEGSVAEPAIDVA